MKLTFYYVKGKANPNYEHIYTEYVEKISRILRIEKWAIKTKSLDRQRADEKVKLESEAILDTIKSTEYLILFDEKGKKYKSSVDFSKALVKIISSHQGRIAFLIGGPYGVSEEVRQRANLQLSLSDLTMNHHVAQAVALEQIYRALTIWRGLPYHND